MARKVIALGAACVAHDGERIARHREFACGGCNAELPLDAFSRVSAQRDDLVTCMNCGRILYMDV
ncbi:MAG: C4-type zinc ribbon domain-containing protein, partial [Phycisphaerales bacterium]